MDTTPSTDKRGWPGSKGKVTAHCLWTACKAIAVGLFLIVIGAVMATLGFYADELSVVVHVDGNKTIFTKDISRDYHLTNLTYVGPIVMGVGGFLIVATCVMTFEARDSAAKVVPARIKRAATKLRSPAANLAPSARMALTTTFVQFSRTIQTSIESRDFNSEGHPLRKCPSAPVLVPDTEQQSSPHQLQPLPPLNFSPLRSNRLLPGALPRQAISVDNPRILARKKSTPATSHDLHTFKKLQSPSNDILKKSDSDTSMAMDLYLPDCAITLHVQDESRLTEPALNRRETFKRRPLIRQEQIDFDPD